MKVILLLFYLFIFSLVGCAYPKKTTPFEFAPIEKDQAIIYLYRLPTSIHSVNPDVPRFYINDKTVGKLVIGGYYVIRVQPGESDISIRNSFLGIPLPWKSQRIRFNVLPGQPVYVKYEVTFLLSPEIHFSVVPVQIGSVEIQQTRLLVP